MGRYKKLNVETKSELRESISDIFEAMKNEEKMSKKGSCNSQKNKILKDYLDNCDSSCSDISDVQSVGEIDHVQKEKENHIIKEKLAIVDKFYKKYPHLKKDKTDFVKEILYKNEKKEKTMTQKFIDLNEYVVEKITIEGKTFYKDEFNNLVNDKLKLAGFYKKNGSMYECYVFNLE